MTAPVSACLIVRDDAHIAKTVECLRPHVAEICIAHTPCEEMPSSVVRKLVDHYVIAPEKPQDFSVVRNMSMALATQPYILWADSDDLITGLEHLPEAIETLKRCPKSRLFCPYEYAYDKDTGEVAWLQRRERIVPNNGRFHWIKPWHEHIVAKDGQYDAIEPYEPRIVWKHQLHEQPGKNERAIRILERYESENPSDPWAMLNLGLEYGRAQEHVKAAQCLERFVAVCGWDDQKALAMIQLVKEHMAIEGFQHGARWQKAQEWASKALEVRPDWFEPYWELAQIAWLRASLLGDNDSVHETIEMCRRARMQPEPNHPLVIKPIDRTYAVHELERNARECKEDWHGALEATERAIANRPNDGQLRMAKRRYEAAIKLEAAEAAEAMTEPPVPFRTGLGTYLMTWPSVRTKLDIVFACGSLGEPWNPAVYAEKGLGGSETAVVEMSKRLAKRGHRVRVYAPCGGPGLYDGVEWHEGGTIATDNRPMCDVLVAWRNAQLLSWADARTSVLWCHDVTAHDMSIYWAMRAQRVLALSEWHKQNLIKAHELAPSQVHVTRNGIDLARFAFTLPVKDMKGEVLGYSSGLPRDPHKAIYSSSADRGLQVLLDVWPAIRARVPDATLSVFYSMQLWKDVAEASGSQQQRYAVLSLERRMKYMAALGVTYHGGVDQVTLAQAMCGAGAWLYPTWFTETSCIGAMEAQAAGLRIVSSTIAALNETVGERGCLLDGDWLDERYQRRFVDAAVFALDVENPSGAWTRKEIQGYARENFSWHGVVSDWENLFEELLREADAGVLPAYEPVAEGRVA